VGRADGAEIPLIGMDGRGRAARRRSTPALRWLESSGRIGMRVPTIRAALGRRW